MASSIDCLNWLNKFAVWLNAELMVCLLELAALINFWLNSQFDYWIEINELKTFNSVIEIQEIKWNSKPEIINEAARLGRWWLNCPSRIR